MLARCYSREHLPRPSHTNRPKRAWIWNNLIYHLKSPLFFYRLLLSLLSLKPHPYSWIRRVLGANRHSPSKSSRSAAPQHFRAISLWVSITWAHHSLMEGNRQHILQALFMTIALGVYFTLLQALEYCEAPFTISDGVYGSTFFVATGFHGLHIIIGSTFLIVCFLHQLKFHFASNHHFGFEAAAWYWHSVDVVWLFLYVSIYWWGS